MSLKSIPKDMMASAKAMLAEARNSPLAPYVGYSTVIHIILVAVLSVGMFLPAESEADKEKTEAAATAKSGATTPAKGEAAKSAPGKEAAKSAAGAKDTPKAPSPKGAPDKSATKPGPAGKTAPSTGSGAPTGKSDDYYKRQGIDATPAKADEIPKNPFDAKDEIKKNLDELK